MVGGLLQRKRKPLPEEGIVKVVSKSMKKNSKLVATADNAFNTAAELTPKVINAVVVNPTKTLTIQLSYYLDYILVSLATFYAVSLFK
mgnify:FL=1